MRWCQYQKPVVLRTEQQHRPVLRCHLHWKDHDKLRNSPWTWEPYLAASWELCISPSLPDDLCFHYTDPYNDLGQIEASAPAALLQAPAQNRAKPKSDEVALGHRNPSVQPQREAPPVPGPGSGPRGLSAWSAATKPGRTAAWIKSCDEGVEAVRGFLKTCHQIEEDRQTPRMAPGCAARGCLCVLTHEPASACQCLASWREG